MAILRLSAGWPHQRNSLAGSDFEVDALKYGQRALGAANLFTQITGGENYFLGHTITLLSIIGRSTYRHFNVCAKRIR